VTLELNRLVAEASVLAGGDHPCTILGHKWVFAGGRNAGCGPDCGCSVPVHQCEGCGDYDYGDNEEADKILAECEDAPTVAARDAGSGI
jgi:hypothetical protein